VQRANGNDYSKQNVANSLTIHLVKGRQVTYCFLKRKGVFDEVLLLEFKSHLYLIKLVLEAIEQVLVLLDRVACVCDHCLDLIDGLLLNREATVDQVTHFSSAAVDDVGLLSIISVSQGFLS
jgi:hypothetical protein